MAQVVNAYKMIIFICAYIKRFLKRLYFAKFSFVYPPGSAIRLLLSNIHNSAYSFKAEDPCFFH